MNLAFSEDHARLRFRFEQPLSDDMLMLLCSENESLRLERDSNGELIVMTPVNSDGGAIKGEVYAELVIWARSDSRGKAFGATVGFKLLDTSVRVADAAWISLGGTPSPAISSRATLRSARSS